jgi:hypothetical protein
MARQPGAPHTVADGQIVSRELPRQTYPKFQLTFLCYTGAAIPDCIVLVLLMYMKVGIVNP